ELSAMADISVEGWVGLGSGGANATCGWGIGMSDYASIIRPTDVGGVAGMSDYALWANPTYDREFGCWGCAVWLDVRLRCANPTYGSAGDVDVGRISPQGVIRQTLANVLPNPPPSLIHFPKAPSGRSTKTPIRHHRSGGPAGEGEPFPHLLGMPFQQRFLFCRQPGGVWPFDILKPLRERLIPAIRKNIQRFLQRLIQPARYQRVVLHGGGVGQPLKALQ